MLADCPLRPPRLAVVPLPRLAAVLCFVSEGEAGDCELWESGEVGGFEAYLLADDDNEAAEVYKAVSSRGARPDSTCSAGLRLAAGALPPLQLPGGWPAAPQRQAPPPGLQRPAFW